MKRKQTLTFDIETYPNYILFALLNIKTNALYTFEIKKVNDTLSLQDIKELSKLLSKNRIITFNGIKFDEVITSIALQGKTAFDLFQISQGLIVDKISGYKMYKIHHTQPCINEHIDIMNVAMGIASLKLYGARIKTKKLQDLPYEVGSYLTKKEQKEVKKYCVNDLTITKELYIKLKPDIDLRADMSKKYNLNLMSDNGAKIAEKILIQESGYKGKVPSIPDYIYYKPPDYIKFKTPQLKSMFKYIKNHKFLLTANGNVELPAKMKQEIMEYNGVKYQMGVGGVHGSVESTSIYAGKNHTILDIDYRALYPSLIIQNNFIPRHIGDSFMKVYKGMYDNRIKVKNKMKSVPHGSKEYKILDTQQKGLKLINNSSFGKMGLRYSKMYDPVALLHITITGQLTLMMVVEKLYLKGFKVFYANTDGITLKVKNKDVNKVKKITQKFDSITGLVMEYNEFKSCHIRDVNNFVNITIDNEVKSKGAYGEPSINKNSQTPVVYQAIRKFLLDGTPMEDTIYANKEVNDFCSSMTVRGGAMYSNKIPEMYPPDWEDKLNSARGLTKKIIKEREQMEAQWVKSNGGYLGKVVRWYYSTKGTSIHYKTNGNKVPKSDSAVPMMELTDEIPKDLDYTWYIKEAYEKLKDLGYDS